MRSYETGFWRPRCSADSLRAKINFIHIDTQLSYNTDCGSENKPAKQCTKTPPKKCRPRPPSYTFAFHRFHLSHLHTHPHPTLPRRRISPTPVSLFGKRAHESAEAKRARSMRFKNRAFPILQFVLQSRNYVCNAATQCKASQTSGALIPDSRPTIIAEQAPTRIEPRLLEIAFSAARMCKAVETPLPNLPLPPA